MTRIRFDFTEAEMATVNPFDLLGNDAEDPSQLAVALPKKVEKAAPVQPAKSGKLPTKQLPSSQAGKRSSLSIVY